MDVGRAGPDDRLRDLHLGVCELLLALERDEKPTVPLRLISLALVDSAMVRDTELLGRAGALLKALRIDSRRCLSAARDSLEILGAVCAQAEGLAQAELRAQAAGKADRLP